MSTIHEKAVQACSDILSKNLKLQSNQRVVLIHQSNSGFALNGLLAAAYTEALASHKLFESIEFNPNSAAELKAKLYDLKKGDVAILIQNTSFQLSSFRIRLDLKNRDIYVIEHNHVEYSTDPVEIENYVNAIQFEGEYYEEMSTKIENALKSVNEVVVVSTDGSKLVYTGPFEKAKKNIGDLDANLGSFYPIGEVFTEPVDLFNATGEFLVYAFPNTQFATQIVDPFKVKLLEGKVVSHDGPVEFSEIINLVKTENERAVAKRIEGAKYELVAEGSEDTIVTEEVWVREMGFGLNRAIGKDAVLSFVSAHERQCGFHISLGLKHGVYRKKMSKRVNQRFHIDMFVDVKTILFDEKVVFEKGKYVI
jgi:aminopeptidase